MVYFKDTRSPLGVEQLVVLDDERQPLDKGTTLVVHTPLIGKYPMQWPRLTSTYNINEWTHEVSLSKTLKVWTLQTSHHKYSDEIVHLPTLGHNIIKGKAMWGESLQFTGEFHYTPGYWEWTEDVLSRCESKLISAQLYDAVYASLFTYDRNSEIIKAFCEAWCPTTNTLLTSLGELSLSLWDLNTLAGLPLTGLLYDEVIPCAEELCGIDATGSRYLPRTCKHLLYVYHLLRKKADDNSQVSIEKWIKFWSKKQLKYHQPPLRKERKKVRPKSTHNPLGSFDAHDEWDTSERELFSKLKIGNDLRTETYLSAFLACWLCTFVLPTDNPDTIRPSTFKMASLMASGRKVGLAVPVLASIYKGLNKISNSPRPTRVSSPFPIHFVYGWLAHYFKTHYPVWQGVRGPKMTTYSGEGGAKYYDSKEARKRIHKGDFASWTCTMITKSKDFLYVDNPNGDELEQNYFIAMRSNYLPLRRGEEFIIEPYSPHRFSRQFGYYQDVPGVLVRDIRRVSLEEGLRHWRLCILSKSMSRAWFSSMPPNAKRFTSEDYKKWWTNTFGSYLDNNIAKLINVDENKPVSKEKLSEIEESLPTPSDVAARTTTPLAGSKINSRPLEESGSSNVDRHWKRSKKDPRPSELGHIDNAVTSPLQTVDTHVNELENEAMNVVDVDGSQDSPKSMIGPNSITATVSVEALTRRPPSEVAIAAQRPRPAAVSVFEGEKFVLTHEKEFLRKLWGDLRIKIVNTPVEFISSIQDNVEIVLQSMKRFSDFDITHVEGLVKTLFENAAAYDEARSMSSEKAPEELLARQLQVVKDRLLGAQTKENKENAQVRATKNELEGIQKQLHALKGQKKKLSSSLKRQQESLNCVHAEVCGIMEEITAIENTSPLSHDMIENVKISMEHLEATKEELKTLDPFA